MKKNILVICPRTRDKQELSNPHIQKNYNIYFYPFDATGFQNFIYKKHRGAPIDIQQLVSHIIAYAQTHNIEGIISSDDYPGSLIASIATHKLGLPGPSPESVVICQDKYLGRKTQKKWIPQATPHVQLVPYTQQEAQELLPLPFFAKPVKACCSMGAKKIETKEAFDTYLKEYTVPYEFYKPLEWAIKTYTKHTTQHACMIEELLEGDIQVTVEGYAFNGTIHIQGIVDSIMYPGTISFSHFVYPSQLPQRIQKKMEALCTSYIAAIGFINGMFNVELMYNPAKETIHIIEVNPRMVSQYADLHEKVDGINTYQIALALATGQKPNTLKKRGTYTIAASFALRLFDDALLTKSPSQKDIYNMQQSFPETRVIVTAQENRLLSESLQDAQSYRYCIINLGAHSTSELKDKLAECLKLLPFAFRPPPKHNKDLPCSG